MYSVFTKILFQVNFLKIIYSRYFKSIEIFDFRYNASDINYR